MATAKVKGSQTVTRARKGDTGNGGITYRISVWESGKVYRNDSSLNTDGERVIDIAVNKAMSMIGDSTFIARKCKVTHTSNSSTIPLTNNTYWEDLNQFQPIVTPVVLAQVISADFIDVANLVAQHVQVKNGNVVVADMGGDSTYPLFLGATTASNAKTKVKNDGELITSKINATGGLITELETKRLFNPFGTISDSFTPIDDDNVKSDILGGSFKYVYSLDWSVKSSGRRQTIIGAVSITAPTGKWFYENGRKYSEFNSSYECSEMIGYGDDENFWGWIVVRRTLFSTNYNFGREVTPLAMGRVNGLGGAASFTISKYTNKDDAKVGANEVMAVAHTGTTGHYYLYVPRSWFTSANYIGIHLTGYGYVDGSSSSICNCGVAAITATTRSGYNVWRIEIVVNDDATPNDGCFFFQLYNMAQWDD